MNGLFNKKFILISLALICIMQNFSELKSMKNILMKMGTPETRNKRRKQKRREKEKAAKAEEIKRVTQIDGAKIDSIRIEKVKVGSDDNSSSDDVKMAITENVMIGWSKIKRDFKSKDLSGNKLARLRSVYSQLMPLFRTATSFAVKIAVLIVMMTATIIIMPIILNIILRIAFNIIDIIDDYEVNNSSSINFLQKCLSIEDSFAYSTRGDFWPMPYDFVTLCTKDPNKAIFACHFSLEIYGLAEYWNSIIVKVATYMCRNFELYIPFLDMFPQIIELPFEEVFKKCRFVS